MRNGAAVIQRARRTEHSREDLIAVRDSCTLCRALQEAWDHRFASCPRRFGVFRERQGARDRQRQRGRDWLQPFTACFRCLNPQSVCLKADPLESESGEECEARDVVLPLCYGIFYSDGGRQWMYERFGRQFEDIGGFFDWIGEESRFGGGRAIQGVRIAAAGLVDMHLY